ncbi:MAG: AMP-binding protein [Clostridiales bacterium]|jgi:acetyl-CoA synthetase|nr:AMP-binding protein [Clostridiales bacterium]
MEEFSMLHVNERYVDETRDEKGNVVDYQYKYPENFNFAYDVVDAIAEAEPGRRAMIWCNPCGEEHVFTYGDLKRYSDKTANMLRAKGIGKGDMVMVVLKRHYQFWFTILALHKLGAVIIPATFLLTKHDIVYRVNSASVKAVICTGQGDVAAHFDESAPECPTLQTKLMVNGERDGWEDFMTEMEKAPESFARVPTLASDPMILYFSSGTTGNPKMALHPYTYALGHLATAKYWHNVDPEGIHFTIADTGWGKAVWGKLYGQMFMESCVFVYDFEKFVASDILDKVSQYGVTSLCCPPTMFRFFLQEDVKSWDLSRLTYCTIAGEALSPDVFNKWYEATGIKLMEGFGQTETTLLIANLVGMEPKPGSMGKPIPQYDVMIVDEDGQPVQPGVTGEIVVKLDHGKPLGLFDCYYRDEKRTKEAMHDGLYHTGDTAWMDEDGYYWYVGRTDDVIKSSGYRIGPFEIESVLAEHPAVLECAVTGVPDPLRGNVVKATIVLRPGFAASEELKKELQNHVKKETAPYKYPRVVEFVDELPKTVNGKIRRVEIRQNDQGKKA